MWPIVTAVVAQSVCLSDSLLVCLLETFVIYAKTDDLIEMRFGVWALWAHVTMC